MIVTELLLNISSPFTAVLNPKGFWGETIEEKEVSLRSLIFLMMGIALL